MARTEGNLDNVPYLHPGAAMIGIVEAKAGYRVPDTFVEEIGAGITITSVLMERLPQYALLFGISIGQTALKLILGRAT